MGNWAEYAKELQDRLRFRTIPLAFKLFESAEQLDKIPRVRRMGGVFPLCQIVTTARTTGWTIGVTKDDLNDMCGSIVGLRKYPMKKWTLRQGVWNASKEDCHAFHRLISRIPRKYEALVLAPLASEKFDPQVVLIWGTPTQIVMILCALQRVEYRRFQFFFSGESSCNDSLAECFNSGNPALSLPCYGERMMAHAAEEELELALPSSQLDQVIEGLRLLWETGNRYPIPSGVDSVLTRVIQEKVYQGRTDLFG